jgi:ribosomal protein S18 acetylase RimI-like enzyme
MHKYTTKKDSILDIERIGSESLPIYYNTHDLIISDDEIYIYTHENKTIGFIIFYLNKEIDLIHIKSIAIDKNERRKGYAKSIIIYLQKLYNIITLYVQKGNTAIELYKKCGFKQIEIIENYYSILEEQCAYLMKWEK